MKTIRERILRGGGFLTGKLLGLYQQVLQNSSPQQGGVWRGMREGIEIDDSPEQIKLRLTGLVVLVGLQASHLVRMAKL